MMRRCLLCLSLLLLFPLAVAAEDNVPQILVHRDLVRLNGVRPNSSTPARFTFSNIGTKPLIIEKVMTSCGCVEAKLSRDVVPPMEDAYVDVVFRAETTRVMVTHKVSLITNDPQKQEVGLSLQISVEPDLEWEPLMLELDWPPKTAYSGKISFKSYGAPLEIKKVSSENNYLKTSILSQEGNAGVIQFTVETGKPYVASNYILVETNSKDFPVAQILVYFRRPAEYVFGGDPVEIDVFANVPPPVYKVTIARTDEKEIKILGIDSSQGECKVRILKNDAKVCEFEVTLDKNMRPGPCDGYLTIRTDQGNAHFPISCNIRPPQ